MEANPDLSEQLFSQAEVINIIGDTMVLKMIYNTFRSISVEDSSTIFPKNSETGIFDSNTDKTCFQKVLVSFNDQMSNCPTTHTPELIEKKTNEIKQLKHILSTSIENQIQKGKTIDSKLLYIANPIIQALGIDIQNIQAKSKTSNLASLTGQSQQQKKSLVLLELSGVISLPSVPFQEKFKILKEITGAIGAIATNRIYFPRKGSGIFKNRQKEFENYMHQIGLMLNLNYPSYNLYRSLGDEIIKTRKTLEDFVKSYESVKKESEVKLINNLLLLFGSRERAFLTKEEKPETNTPNDTTKKKKKKKKKKDTVVPPPEPKPTNTQIATLTKPTEQNDTVSYTTPNLSTNNTQIKVSIKTIEQPDIDQLDNLKSIADKVQQFLEKNIGLIKSLKKCEVDGENNSLYTKTNKFLKRLTDQKYSHLKTIEASSAKNTIESIQRNFEQIRSLLSCHFNESTKFMHQIEEIKQLLSILGIQHPSTKKTEWEKFGGRKKNSSKQQEEGTSKTINTKFNNIEKTSSSQVPPQKTPPDITSQASKTVTEIASEKWIVSENEELKLASPQEIAKFNTKTLKYYDLNTEKTPRKNRIKPAGISY